MPDSLRRDLERLVEHYRQHCRDLPWRRTTDPYAVLVSEVMLQQTQVDRVVTYFTRFMSRFPDVESLAAAEPDEVLACWSGLGYYARGRRLHQAARAVRDQGGFPDTETALRALPGIGEYTAAALASIAFGRRAVALDTNALRVLARYLGESRDPSAAGVRRALRDRVIESFPDVDPGELTQAVMELGALVCRPRAPRCSACPMAAGCRARAQGVAEALPASRARKPRVNVIWAVARVAGHGGFLLTREAGELLTGQWTCPGLLVESAEAARAALEAWLGAPGSCHVQGYLGEVRHGITYRNIRCLVFGARWPGPAPPDSLWVTRERLDEVPLPSLTRKVLNLTAGEDRNDPASWSEPAGRPR